MLYLYSNDEITTTLQDNGASSILRANVHALFSVHKKSGNERTELLACDVKGSTLMLLTINSTAPVAFNPWGYSHAAGGMLAGFKGEYCDPVTSYYLLGNGYRGYNPMLMRFTGPDSVSPFGAGGINCYAYLAGDPVNASDPTGHMRGKVLLRENNLAVFTSRKRFWQKKALNIYAHGKNSKVAGMDADALYEHLSTQKISFERYEKIHIIACHSGEPGPDGQLSFGQRFSDITRTIVKRIGEPSARYPSHNKTNNTQESKSCDKTSIKPKTSITPLSGFNLWLNRPQAFGVARNTPARRPFLSG